MTSAFLNAEWRKLVMANYAVDSTLLKQYLPANTEMDVWNGTCYVSLVGFMFINTKMLGLRIPFHVNFEEVNLRFYVRYLEQESWKRGVVFIREFVPKPALTLVANTFYGEHYETLPMNHSWTLKDTMEVSYSWEKGKWNSIRVKTALTSQEIISGSEAEFITEHYWGYTRLTESHTSEYGVEHPRWQVYPVLEYAIDVDFGTVYGAEFQFLNSEKPISVFLAEGSEIVVRKGRQIKA